MKTKIILSFDDGRVDNYNLAKNILVPKNIPATFNITVDYIENKNTETNPCPNLAMTKEQVVELSKEKLFEIAGHGKKHNNNIDNLILGVKELCDWCNINIKGIASPNSKLSLKEILKYEEIYKEHGINYIRLGDRIFKLKLIKRVLRKINKFFHNCNITKYVFKDSFITKKDSFIFPSIPILNHITTQEVFSLIEKAIQEEKSIILMFHSICKPKDKFYNDLWSWDYDKFNNLCEYLLRLKKEGKIEICKTKDLIIKEEI